MTAGQTLLGEASRKIPVFAASGAPRIREELSNSLRPFYNIRTFDKSEAVLKAVSKSQPAAIVIDETIPPMGGMNLIKTLRKEATSKTLPLVYTANAVDAESLDEAKSYGQVEPLGKPYQPRSLVGAISRMVNAGVEASWEKIEPVQKEALKNTLTSFNAIADQIQGDDPIAYGEVRESCTPLVTAIQNQNFKDMLRGVQDHDNYSFVHSLRVATFLSLFGTTVGIKGDELMVLATGGLLHDLGKMYIPHEVLNKAGKLDDTEFNVMKSHVSHTQDHLDRNSELPSGIAVIAGQHHEKLDGSGYPNGLKGSQINELARMAAIVDIFGALTDRRVYKDPMPPEKALVIMADMKTHLDQNLLALFREMLLDSATL